MVADDDSLPKEKLQYSYTELMEKYLKFVWIRVNVSKLKYFGNIDLNIPEP